MARRCVTNRLTDPVRVAVGRRTDRGCCAGRLQPFAVQRGDAVHDAVVAAIGHLGSAVGALHDRGPRRPCPPGIGRRFVARARSPGDRVVRISGTWSAPSARRDRSMMAPAEIAVHCLSSPRATMEKPWRSCSRSSSSARRCADHAPIRPRQRRYSGRASRVGSPMLIVRPPLLHRFSRTLNALTFRRSIPASVNSSAWRHASEAP